jgi:sugar phosphate isomerase/epimerase
MYHDDFDVFFDSVQDGYVTLTVDTAHLAKSGIEDIASIIRNFSDYIDNFHLKDFAEGEFRVLGEGAVDFAPVFAEMRALNFDGWLCADEESGGDINETLSQCYEFMRSGMAEKAERGRGD